MRYLILFFCLVSFGTYGQNTVSFAKNGTSPKANISQIAWMEGHWKGEAFGGITEEIWSPALAGSMMFSFKLVVDGETAFYEFGHIRQLEEALVFELKHFHGDLKGWEEKNEVQSFKLVKIEENRMYFDGFTFEKISDTEVNIYAKIDHEDGSTEEVRFNYRRHQE